MKSITVCYYFVADNESKSRIYPYNKCVTLYFSHLVTGTYAFFCVFLHFYPLQWKQHKVLYESETARYANFPFYGKLVLLSVRKIRGQILMRQPQ